MRNTKKYLGASSRSQISHDKHQHLASKRSHNLPKRYTIRFLTLTAQFAEHSYMYLHNSLKLLLSAITRNEQQAIIPNTVENNM
jgi:hypothetical protein